MDFSRVVEVLRALEAEGVRYVLVGGVAVNLHGVGRTTQDLDLFLPSDFENIEKLKAALRRVFEDPSIEEISAEDLAGAYPTVRYVPPDESFVIEDEGDGFDHRRLPDPTSAASLFEVSGRGLLIMRLTMDEVFWNEKGNRLHMVWRPRPKPA